MSAPTLTPTAAEVEHVNDYCIHHCGPLALTCGLTLRQCLSRATPAVPVAGGSHSSDRPRTPSRAARVGRVG